MHQVGPGFNHRKGPFQGVILGHAHTCPRSISSTLFAFELVTSVMFNSLNMLSKLLQTKTANSFNRFLDWKLAKQHENAHNRRRTQIIHTGKPCEVLQSNFQVASHCIAWDAVYCYTCSVVCVCVCLLQGHKRQPIKKNTKSIEMHAVLVWICMAQGTVTVLDGAGISYEKRHLLGNGNKLLGHTQTCLLSIVSTLFAKRQQRWLRFHNNLFILLFQWYCLQSCFSGLQLGIDVPSRLLANVEN